MGGHDSEKAKSGKKICTSELLDWFEVLARHPKDQVLAQLQGELPYPEVLLKSWEDHLNYLQATPHHQAMTALELSLLSLFNHLRDRQGWALGVAVAQMSRALR